MMLSVWFLALILGAVATERKNSTTGKENNDTLITAGVEAGEKKLSSVGHIASIVDYPYVVSINGDVNCTGVIVDTRYVLTTLQCLKKINFTDETESTDERETTVRVGSDYFSKYGQVKRLKWLYDHPFSDIMPDIFGFVMAELSEPLAENSELFYETAIFSNLHDPKEERINALVKRGAICTMVGFGDYHSGRRKQGGALHKIPMKLLDWSACEDGGTQIQPLYEICAALPTHHPTFCVNEVSAPLVCNHKVYGVLTGHNETCSIKLDRPARFLRTDQANGFMTLIKDCVDSNDCYSAHSERL